MWNFLLISSDESKSKHDQEIDSQLHKPRLFGLTQALV